MIEDLSNKGYGSLLTARSQGNLLERRLGQFRQTSSGRFSVGLKSIKYCRKVLKYKAYYK